jgi:hypothetical protein
MLARPRFRGLTRSTHILERELLTSATGWYWPNSPLKCHPFLSLSTSEMKLNEGQRWRLYHFLFTVFVVQKPKKNFVWCSLDVHLMFTWCSWIRVSYNGWVGRQFPLSHRSVRQPQTYVKPEAAITVCELLVMGGMYPETCWAIKKHWNNKFYYTVASCWFFLWVLRNLCYTVHNLITNISTNKRK